jgi:predicted Kef-type K+ transport protein
MEDKKIMNTRVKLENIAFPLVVALASIVFGTLLLALCYRLGLAFELSIVLGYSLSTISTLLLINFANWDKLKTSVVNKWNWLRGTLLRNRRK